MSSCVVSIDAGCQAPVPLKSELLGHPTMSSKVSFMICKIFEHEYLFCVGNGGRARAYKVTKEDERMMQFVLSSFEGGRSQWILHSLKHNFVDFLIIF